MIVQLQAVGHEGVVHHLFHHRVAAVDDLDARLVHQIGAHPVQGFRPLRQTRQHVQLGHRRGAGLQWAEIGGQLLDQRFVKALLQIQRLAGRGQRLVLELLQLRCDKALGVLQRLAALVIHRRLVRLAAGQLNIVAVHPVVLDPQRGKAGALTLAGFNVHQHRAGVLADRTQLVQLFAVARRDHTAVADQHGRVLDHRPFQQRHFVREVTEPVVQPLEHRVVGQGGVQLRQRRQADVQPRQVAGPGGAQRHPAENPFHIADPVQHLAGGLEAPAVAQGGDAVLALAEHRAITQRPVHPALEQPRPHRRLSAVQHPGQRRRLLAGEGFSELQIAARGGVHGDAVVERLQGQPGDVGQRTALGVPRVLEQRPRRGHRHRRRLTETGQILHAELLAQLPPRGLAVEVPGWPLTTAGPVHQRYRQPMIFADQQLRRLPALQQRLQLLVPLHPGHHETTGGHVQARRAHRRAVLEQRAQQRVAALLQQRLVAHRPRRHDAHHLALHRPLGQRRIADLLADHHRLAQLHQPRQIPLGRVIGNPRHRNRLAVALAALRQGDIQQPRRLLRVAEKQLVEIPHPVEHQLIRVLGLNA